MRTKVFISYSHEDVEYKEQLLKHLAYYERNNLLELWSDEKIAAGAQWGQEIKRAIETTRIAVLLISPSFMASDFIAEKQLPSLLDAAKKDGMIVLPVIVKPFNLDDTELANFQPVNRPSMSVAKMKSYKKDEFWVEVVEKIRIILKENEKTEEVMDESSTGKIKVGSKKVVDYLKKITLFGL